MNTQLLFVLAYSMLLHFVTSSARLGTTLDALAHGASSWEVGALMSMIGVLPMFFSLAYGRWVDSADARAPLFAGLAMGGVAVAAPLLLPSSAAGLWPLAFCCAFMGLAAMSGNIVTQRMTGFVSSNAKGARTSAFAMLAVSNSLAGLVAPVATGYIADNLGHQVIFISLLAALAVTAAVTLAGVRMLPERWGAKKKKSSGSFDLMRIRGVRNTVLISTVVTTAWDMQIFIFPVYGHAVGLTATEIGWLVGSYFTASFLVRFLMPVLSKRFDEWTFLGMALATGAVVYGVFPLFTSLAPLMCIAFALGLGLGACMPNVMSLLHTHAPEGRIASKEEQDLGKLRS
ncbi:MAG: MFS transporter, partial [Duodenibacillus sp.]|nr:MFS transporter [Duodenibacillus sp.]